jgi:phage gp36-like protein
MLARLTQPELQSLSTVVMKVGQVDRLQTVWKQCIDLVRGKVAACARFRMYAQDPAVPVGSIPEELYSSFLEVARYRLINSLPLSLPMATPERRKTYEDALLELEQVAACKIEIAPGQNSAGMSALTGINWGSQPQIDFDPQRKANPWYWYGF